MWAFFGSVSLPVDAIDACWAGHTHRRCLLALPTMERSGSRAGILKLTSSPHCVDFKSNYRYRIRLHLDFYTQMSMKGTSTDFLKWLDVPDLRKQCLNRSLPVDGSKSELLVRLKAAICLEQHSQWISPESPTLCVLSSALPVEQSCLRIKIQPVAKVMPPNVTLTKNSSQVGLQFVSSDN